MRWIFAVVIGLFVVSGLTTLVAIYIDVLFEVDTMPFISFSGMVVVITGCLIVGAIAWHLIEPLIRIK